MTFDSILGLHLSAAESETGWLLLLSDLQKRGAKQLDIVVSDGNEGLIAALRQVYPQVPHQRCIVHKERNVLSYIPKRERGSVGTELRAIWQAPTREKAQAEAATFVAKYTASYPEAVKCLQRDLTATLEFYALPVKWWLYIKTTNAMKVPSPISGSVLTTWTASRRRRACWPWCGRPPVASSTKS